MAMSDVRYWCPEGPTTQSILRDLTLAFAPTAHTHRLILLLFLSF